MSIKIRIAENARELEDVFRLRHTVYVEQEGVFQDADQERVFDRFDVQPPVTNLVAYDGDKAVGTLRINLDTGAGLPADELYDYSEYRDKITSQWAQDHDDPPRFVGAGMLAIGRDSRNRRDVIRALFKQAAGVAHAWKSTHILASINSKTVRMYKRFGFESLDERQWIAEIGDHITPMVGLFEDYYNRIFDGFNESREFLDVFSGCFQRLLVSAGEVVFDQGSNGREVFFIDSGTIRISERAREAGKEVTLATLGSGAVFGELSLIDAKPRSATVTALSNCELLFLDRKDFLNRLREQPDNLQDILEIFAARLRRSNELIATLHSTVLRERINYSLNHALEDLRNSAVPDVKRPGTLLSKVGLAEFARNADVDEQVARDYLEEKKQDNYIEYMEHRIRFLKTG